MNFVKRVLAASSVLMLVACGGGGSSPGTGGIPGDCTASALTTVGPVQTSAANIEFTSVKATLEHKIDVDPYEDGCVVRALLELRASTKGCTLAVEFAGVSGTFGGLKAVTLKADSFCPGFPDAQEGTYTAIPEYGPWWYLGGPNQVPQRMAERACVSNATLTFADKPITLKRSDGAELILNLKDLSLSGDLFSTGSPSVTCVNSSVCGGGFHDDGSGWCTSKGCVSGFHEGGDGQCAAIGTCSKGFRLDPFGACITWTKEASGTTVDLTDVWGSGPNDIWAVGQGDIVRWNGTAWVTSPNAFAYYTSVWGSGANDVWVLGGPSALRWNGSTWTAVPLAAGSLYFGLWGTGPADVWAVGYDGYISHWNGTAFTRVPSGFRDTLLSVWGSGPNDVWAVGGSGRILRWNGTKWASVASGTTKDLYSVWGSGPNDVWAVGGAGTILRWNGTAWTAVTSGTDSRLTGVWGSGPSNVWTVGDQGPLGDGTVLRWNGSMWIKVPIGAAESLTSVWGSGPNDVRAVSRAGTTFRGP